MLDAVIKTKEKWGANAAPEWEFLDMKRQIFGWEDKYLEHYIEVQLNSP